MCVRLMMTENHHNQCKIYGVKGTLHYKDKQNHATGLRKSWQGVRISLLETWLLILNKKLYCCNLQLIITIILLLFITIFNPKNRNISSLKFLLRQNLALM